MAETWCLFLLDDRASPLAPEGLAGLLGSSLWDRATREVQTLAILRFDGEAPADLDGTLAGAGWPEPEWRVRLAMAPTPPMWAEEIDGKHRRTIHLASFPTPEARDRFAAAQQPPAHHFVHRGEEPATGDAWAIPLSSAPRPLSDADRHHRDEFCGLRISWDLCGETGREFPGYDRRL